MVVSLADAAAGLAGVGALAGWHVWLVSVPSVVCEAVSACDCAFKGPGQSECCCGVREMVRRGDSAGGVGVGVLATLATEVVEAVLS